jgi:hypothetical protein
MSKLRTLAYLTSLLLLAVAVGQTRAPVAAEGGIAEDYGKIPLSFEANQGQTDSSVKFLARGDGYALYLTPKEAVFKLRKGPADHGDPSVLRMELLGANGAVQIAGAEKLPGTVNYFMGNDPKQWHSGIATFAKVDYRGIYPGVDAVFYGNQRQFEYDFTVAPGADPKQIAMAFTGARPKLDGDGNVILALDGDHVILHRPVVYQGEGAARKVVDGSFVVSDNRVDLLIGPYDHTRTLVIDPVITYLTYLGGSTPNDGQAAWNGISCYATGCANGLPEGGQGIAVDSNGNLYVTGVTSTIDFPTAYAIQSTNNSASQWTAYVTELNPTGTGLVYSTYLGGSGNETGNAIAVDANGSAYVVGVTNSGDFPTTSGAYMPQCPIQSYNPNVTYCQTDGGAFLSKLSSDGQLVYSTYFVTPTYWLPIVSVAIDSQGLAYIAGNTPAYCNSSTTSFCFPTTANALLGSGLVTQNFDANPGMAFLTVFSADGSSLVYSTLFGDNNPYAHSYLKGDNTASWTKASGVAVDPSGNFYLAGYTADPHLPVSSNAYVQSLSATGTAYDSYVAKFSPVSSTGGPQLLYCTYLGGVATGVTAYDQATGIVADANGYAYITGLTNSQDYPTTLGVYDSSSCEGNCAFLTKLKPDGSGLVWSDMVADGSTDEAFMIMPPRLDALGNLYVEVQTPYGYPVVNPVEEGQVNQIYLGITKFNPTASTMYFSSILGGSGPNGSSVLAAGLDVDPLGNIYVGGMDILGNLPTTTGAFQTTIPTSNQHYSGFLAQIYPFFNTTTGLGISIGGVTQTPPVTALVGQTVTFTATVNTNQNGTATGTVNFMNGDTLLGSGTLNTSDTATFSTSSLDAGGYSVTAVYLGDNTFAGSTSAPAQSLTINSSQTTTTITFGAAPTPTYGGGNFTVSATTNSNGTLGFSVSSGPCTLVSSTATSTALSSSGAGTCVVQASVAATTDYTAGSATQNVIIGPATATITFGTAPTPTYLGPNFTVTAQTNSNGTLGFSVSSGPCAIVSSTATSATLSSSGAGTCVVQASVAATTNYTAASATQNVAINPATPTITFSAAPSATYPGSNFTVSATTNSNGALTYTYVSGPCSQVSGGTFSPSGVGTCIVQASTAATTNFTAGSATQSVTITAATQTQVLVLPPILRFLPQPVDIKSVAERVVALNTGSAALTFSNITISGDFAQTNNCTGSIAPGKSCTISVTFTPTTTGRRTGALTLTDNAKNSPQTVPLTGLGIPQVVLLPTSLSFAAQKVGTRSAAERVILTNNLPSTLTVSGITFTGADPGDFSETNTCGAQVPAKGDCTISVRFKPTATGARTATLEVSDSANNSPQTVSLMGTGR